nr:MAG: hypothetical protein [Crogonang virus 127]
MFIKPEPHKATKAESGAWRMIWGISCVDQISAFLLWHHIITTVPLKWGQTSSMVGWSPQLGGHRWLTELFDADRKSVQCADKSSWDWTVQPWLADLVSDIIVDLLAGDCQIIKTVAKNHCLSMLGYQRIDLNGLKLQFRNAGRLPSGWLFTIFFNCIGQSAVDALACLRSSSKRGLLKAMGDDTIQSPQPERYWRELKTLCLVKQVETYLPGSRYEFCGTLMNRFGGVPSKRNSHAFRLHFLSDDVRDETLQSYLYLYACDSQAYELLASLLIESSPDRVIPNRLARSWYTGKPIG